MSALSPDRWQEVSPYLEHALSLPEKERAEWLHSLEGENPEIALLLQSLLQEHAIAAEEGFLEGHPAHPTNESSLAGQVIGAYTLNAPIGQGGMGTVWLASRNDGRFQRQVAVKFLNFALASQSNAQRFKREGTILGSLSHPHIAELIDAGVTPAGAAYLVIEYVEGKPIDQYCDQQKLDVEARIRLFLDVLGAVAQAHSILIVHRDIKPSNVLVSNDGQVKLLDFGIAKLLADQEATGEATALTMEGGGGLTPQFAAPEQVTGGAVTTATDVYALGVLLYVLLSGQHPAGSATHSPAELVKAIVETEPARPSSVIKSGAAESRGSSTDKVARKLRGDLDTILGKALKKNPLERYRSVSEFGDDLRRYLDQEPIRARRDTITYRATKFVRRNRTAVVLSAMVVLATIAGLIGTLLQARTARRQRDFAFRQLRRAEAINDFNQFILSDAFPSGKPFTTKDLLDYARKILERQQDTSTDRVELLSSIGIQYSLLGDQKEATSILEKAYNLSRNTPDPELHATTSCQFASVLVRTGDLQRAEELFQEGMRVLPPEPDYDAYRMGCLQRGTEVAQERGDTREGIARVEAAQQMLRNSRSTSDWEKIEVLMDLGEAYRMDGEFYKANSAFDKVNALLISTGRDQTRTAGVLYNDWGLTLFGIGRPLESEKLLRKSIEIQGGGVADSAPPVLLNNYALALRNLGRLQEALTYSQKAYRSAQQKNDHFADFRALYLQAMIYIDQGHFDQAAEVMAKLDPMVQQRFPDSIWTCLATSVRALLESGRGHSEKALALADDAVTTVQRLIRAGGPGDALSGLLFRRATVELAAGRPAQAEADLDSAIAGLKARIPPGAFSYYLGSDYSLLGNALHAEGKMSEARAAFRNAAENFERTVGPDHPDLIRARELAANL